MIRPVRNLILVRPEKPKEISEGGIVLPERAQQQLPRGVVCAFGPDWGAKETPFPIGATVLYSHYAGFDVEEESTDPKDASKRVTDKYLILSPDDIVGVDV